MRISDWSSDVCSSDLPIEREDLPEETIAEVPAGEVDASITPPAAQPGVASFTVQYASPDVGSVSATESAVGGVPGVQSATTTSLALGGTSVMRVTFRGDIAALKAADRKSTRLNSSH